jgi:hypothetical protein
MTHHCIPALFTLLAITTAVRADTLLNVTEGFAGTTLDAQKWSLVRKTPAAAFAPDSQRLNYTTSATPSDDDYADVQLLTVQPAYDKDWEVIVDVSNSAVPAGADDWSGVGISIVGAQNPDRFDEVFIELGDEFSDQKRFFSNFITNDLDTPETDDILPATGSNGSLRVAFNGTTKVFALSVDRTGSVNGYQWEALGSYGIAGSGGQRNTNWEMEGDGTFTVGLYGLSGNMTIGAGQITLDNFTFSGEIASPPDGFSSAWLAGKTFYGVSYDPSGAHPLDSYSLAFTPSEFHYTAYVPLNETASGPYTIKNGAILVDDEGANFKVIGLTADYLSVEFRDNLTSNEIEYARWYFDPADAQAALANLPFVPRATLSVDGNFADWTGITSAATGSVTSGVINILSLKYAIDDQNVYFMIEADRPIADFLPSTDSKGWNRTLWVSFNDDNEFGTNGTDGTDAWFGNGYKEGGQNESLAVAGSAFAITGALLEGRVPLDRVRGTAPQFMKIEAEFGADSPSGANETEDDYPYSELNRMFRVGSGLETDPVYISWTTAAGLSGANAHPKADPYGDGVPNLLKFAFNMNASAADRRILIPGTGVGGLPFTRVERSQGNTLLVIEYVRRKNSGLQYVPQFCADLGAWSPANSGFVVQSIDAQWERVTVTDPGGINNPARRFGRVVVQAP